MVFEKLLDKSSIGIGRFLCIYILMFAPLMLCGQTQEEAQALHDKGRELMEAGKVTEGRDYTKRALDMRKQLFGEVNEDYINSLNNYANSFCMEENYPKHSFVFLVREDNQIKAKYANDYVQKPTDNLRRAVENDVIRMIPDDSNLDILED